MRLLLDTRVWLGGVTELTAHGHDVLWVGDWPVDPGDDEILAFALKERRTIVPLDKCSARQSSARPQLTVQCALSA